MLNEAVSAGGLLRELLMQSVELPFQRHELPLQGLQLFLRPSLKRGQPA